MYVVREVMQCKPGKVRDMVGKFKSISGVMQKMGLAPFRIMTDVSGESFWTIVAETEAASLNEFVAAIEKVMANEDARRAMTGYHDLVERGRREIYKLEG